jgi:hypothetical protein
MDKNRNISVAIIGIILVLIGIFSMFGQYFAFWNMEYLWPLIVVGVGAGFIIAMLLGDRSLGGLAIPGTILITIGLILFVMNFTNTWEAWSYCWALIVSAVGAGVWLNGVRSGQPELRKRGFDTLRVGLYLFIFFGVIMEFIFYVTGAARWGSLLLWSILLSLVGVYLVASRLLRMGRPEVGRVDLFWPVVMVGVGLVGIFAQFNWMTADNLGRLASLWPVLLIVAGIGLIFRYRSPLVGATLGVLLVAGVLVVGFAGAQLGIAPSTDWFYNIGTIQIGDVSRETITGSGKLVTETRQLSGVSRVGLAIDANLEIQQGEQESITITGDDNIVPVLQTNVSGGTLTIRYQSQVNVRNVHQPKLVLTVKELSGLTASSSGIINVGPITTGDFSISLSSSCDVNFQNIQAGQITTHISSSGGVDMQGTANSLRLTISSSGDFQGGDLQVQEANVTSSSSGNATLWVVNSLLANLSSSGNVAYYGEPTVNQHTSSSGRVTAKGAK